MELFDEIRRQYEFGAGTVQGVANKLRVHRRRVRQALQRRCRRSARNRNGLARSWNPLLHSSTAFWKATGGRRVNSGTRRIGSGNGFARKSQLRGGRADGAAVRAAAQGRVGTEGRARRSCRRATSGAAKRRWIGTKPWAEIGGEPQKLQVFAMRSMASGGAFHRAYRHATQQAFLEAHELAFGYFGGVFRLLRYDNLESAVKKILRGSAARGDDTVDRISFALAVSRRSFAIPARATRRAAWKAKWAIFGATTGCRCRKRETWSELNEQLLQLAGMTRSGASQASRRRWASDAGRDANICCRWPRKDSSWRRSVSRGWMRRAASRCARTATRRR